MHPALMIAVMEERDREIAQADEGRLEAALSPSRGARQAPRPRRRSRLSAAFARTTAAFFG